MPDPIKSNGVMVINDMNFALKKLSLREKGRGKRKQQKNL